MCVINRSSHKFTLDKSLCQHCITVFFRKKLVIGSGHRGFHAIQKHRNKLNGWLFSKYCLFEFVLEKSFTKKDSTIFILAENNNHVMSFFQVCFMALVQVKFARNQRENYPNCLMIFQFCPVYVQKMQEKSV